MVTETAKIESNIIIIIIIVIINCINFNCTLGFIVQFSRTRTNPKRKANVR